MKKIIIIFILLFAGCVSMPDGVKPVDHFQAQRYLGKWYEIARLDHSFERGLSRVTAQYSRREDGGIRVVNRGYLAGEGKWKEAEGRAYFVNGPDQGFLKVSFFGPFYGSYVILELDQQNYTCALVCGPDKSYLWILARSPELDKDIMNRLISRASSLGFDTGKLIFVKHDERDKT
ncbi:MAG: lipocalin family protein [Smithellaceae bacterium]|nr:lipocalin family protein [Smithellaceae bacterium]